MAVYDPLMRNHAWLNTQLFSKLSFDCDLSSVINPVPHMLSNASMH